MIRHLVFFKFKEENKIHLNEAVKMLLAMNGKIPGMLSISAGLDILKTPRSWDLGLIADFKSQEDLQDYQVHPVHEPVKKFLAGLYFEAASVDFEI